MTFTVNDLEDLTETVVRAWSQGGDWSAKAGTLEWTCAQTAAHAIDTVLAPAIFLASRKLDGYPDFGIAEGGEDPADLIERLQTASRILVAVVQSAPPEARAVIWRRPTLEVRGPADFVPRAGLELILHAHDVCAGLQVPLAPGSELCERLRSHTRDWPMWTSAGWTALTMTGDAWTDLLRAAGRRPPRDT